VRHRINWAIRPLEENIILSPVSDVTTFITADQDLLPFLHVILFLFCLLFSLMGSIFKQNRIIVTWKKKSLVFFHSCISARCIYHGCHTFLRLSVYTPCPIFLPVFGPFLNLQKKVHYRKRPLMNGRLDCQIHEYLFALKYLKQFANGQRDRQITSSTGR